MITKTTYHLVLIVPSGDWIQAPCSSQKIKEPKNTGAELRGFRFVRKMDWLMLLLSPFVVAFVYPVVLLIMMYGSAVFLHVYRHRRREIYDAYTDNFWDGAMQTVAAVFDSHGSLWHGENQWYCNNL